MNEDNSSVRVLNLEKLHQIANTIYNLRMQEQTFAFLLDEDCKEKILVTLAMAQSADQLYEMSLSQRSFLERGSLSASLPGRFE